MSRREGGARAARRGGVAVLAAASLLVSAAATYAYWTSPQASVPALEAAAGTVEVDLTNIGTITDLAPGEGGSGSFTVTNTGTLPVRYTISGAATDVDATGAPGPGQLFANGLVITIERASDSAAVTLRQGRTAFDDTAFPARDLPATAGPGVDTYRVAWSLPATAPPGASIDDAIRDTSSLTITVNGLQGIRN